MAPASMAPAKETRRSETWLRVLQALRKLGFRDAQAQRAVAVVTQGPGVDPPVEQALRAAVKALTDLQR
jgi:Holliday junction resolvasome RuvABC DNA-binding subunit